MTELHEAKAAVNLLRREVGEAITAGEWMVASTKAHELSERLEDVAALDGGQ